MNTPVTPRPRAASAEQARILIDKLKADGLTRKEISAATGIPRGTLNRVAQGHGRYVSRNLLDRLESIS